MRYTVVWSPEAERRLAALWVNAPDRDAVTEAANRIDTRLRFSPETQGESRADGRRILLDAPLGVIYRVLPDDGVVYVVAAWAF